MDDFKYCPMCRASLRKEHIDGRQRLVCEECGWINYKNPLPVVVCLVSDREGRVLLVKRGVEPCKGYWALPGGFIESGETIPEAGKRELLEETGISGNPGRLVGAHEHKSPLYGSILVLGMEFTADNRQITPGDDAAEAKFASAQDLPEIPFRSHISLIREFFSS
ncbi:MAG: NUDIX domain-containing protein [Candidatus Omnitrophica bacterium]|nr:NUDIX domain-containing protein [Candidatus Omnitrophota bacterium]